MNAGLLVFILLLALSFLGIPIYIALGIGTLVGLVCILVSIYILR